MRPNFKCRIIASTKVSIQIKNEQRMAQDPGDWMSLAFYRLVCVAFDAKYQRP